MQKTQFSKKIERSQTKQIESDWYQVKAQSLSYESWYDVICTESGYQCDCPDVNPLCRHVNAVKTCQIERRLCNYSSSDVSNGANMAQISDLEKSKIAECTYTTTNEVTERLTDVGNNMQQSTNNNAKTIKTRKSSMLANPDIKRWYDNLSRGSRITAQTSMRRLDRFCQMHQMTPMQLAHLATRDQRTATDLLVDHVSMMEEQRYSPGYTDSMIKAVKSWLGHFDVKIQRRIKISNPHKTPTLENERVPNEQEMNEIFNKASQRDAVIISLIAKAGLRPESISNDQGTDGIMMKDLPDVVIQGGVARCIKRPMRSGKIGDLKGQTPVLYLCNHERNILHTLIPEREAHKRRAVTRQLAAGRSLFDVSKAQKQRHGKAVPYDKADL